MIRKIILVVVISAFAFNSFGFVLYFLLEREKAKEEAFEKITEFKNHEKLELISVSTNDLQNGKIIQRINHKEIRFNGRMLDIVKIVYRKDKITFYCIYDEKEDKLENQFADKINKNINDKNAVNSNLNFNHQIQFADTGNKFNLKSPINDNLYSNFLEKNYQLNYQNILTPPPKF